MERTAENAEVTEVREITEITDRRERVRKTGAGMSRPFVLPIVRAHACCDITVAIGATSTSLSSQEHHSSVAAILCVPSNAVMLL